MSDRRRAEPITVAVVEDQVVVREVLTSFFGEEGVQVVFAARSSDDATALLDILVDVASLAWPPATGGGAVSCPREGVGRSGQA